MLLFASGLVWTMAVAAWVAAAESAPSPAEIEAISPRRATLLEAGPWFPASQPAAPAQASGWTEDLWRLCAPDRRSEEERLRAVYGVGEYAGHLFESIRHAAAIFPRFVDLVYEPSDRYMPQMGLLLVEYVELPTRTFFREEGRGTAAATGHLANVQTASAAAPAGRAVTVIGIRDYVNGRSAAAAATPETIAMELRQHVDACRSRLPGLRHVTPTDAAQAQQLTELLDRIELNANLGEHLIHKVQAALAWERFRKGEATGPDCTHRLRESLDDWARVVISAERAFSRPFLYWQPQVVSAPPWSLRSYQASYATARAQWRQQQLRFERELQLISESIRQKRASAMLPLWDRVNSIPTQRLDPVQAFGFNLDPDLRYTLKEGAMITADGRLALTGGRSVLIDTRPLGSGEHVVFQTDPAHATMLAYRAYQISLLYRVIDRGGQDNEPFEIGVMGPDGQPVLGELRRWGAPDHAVDSRVIRTPRLERDNYSFFLKVHGPAAIVIDDLRISALKDD